MSELGHKLLAIAAGPKLSDALAMAAGSVQGREHARLGRSCQDGIALHAEDGLLVAVVTDGCSSGRHSEVGANLAAAYLATWTAELARRDGGVAPSLVESATGGLLEYLRLVAQGLSPAASAMPATVQDFLLFSFLCAVVDERRAMVFGVGDGVFSLNGRVTILDAGPKNAPRYLGYRLVPEAVDSEGSCAGPEHHLFVPTEEVDSLAIATDGVTELIARADEPLRSGDRQGGLAELIAEPGWLRNPSLLQKRLWVIGELNRRLHDDTTLAIIRRRRGAIEERPWMS
ncbi:MAG: protein phosphatase 2C domain-containing protein [Myxococcales bacterium]|nr:protein phosphatase 2C domain-containing protein [Myxococcales bacterium]